MTLMVISFMYIYQGIIYTECVYVYISISCDYSRIQIIQSEQQREVHYGRFTFKVKAHSALRCRAHSNEFKGGGELVNRVVFVLVTSGGDNYSNLQ